MGGIAHALAVLQPALCYDASTDTYTYLFKTQKSWVGTCRHFVLSFTDGTSYTADFQFKK
jgi:hypothetical protein